MHPRQVLAGAWMQHWLEDSDLDRIMKNYDANEDGECAHLLSTGTVLSYVKCMVSSA